MRALWSLQASVPGLLLILKRRTILGTLRMAAAQYQETTGLAGQTHPPSLSQGRKTLCTVCNYSSLPVSEQKTIRAG
jgi:hypothetical protein